MQHTMTADRGSVNVSKKARGIALAEHAKWESKLEQFGLGLRQLSAGARSGHVQAVRDAAWACPKCKSEAHYGGKTKRICADCGATYSVWQLQQRRKLAQEGQDNLTRTLRDDAQPWFNSKNKVAELLTTVKSRKQVLRWVRVIQLYFRLGMSSSEVAAEMSLTRKAVEDLVERIRRAAIGLRTDGEFRKRD